MNALSGMFGGVPHQSAMQPDTASTFLQAMIDDQYSDQLNKYSVLDQDEKLLMAINPGKFQKLKQKLQLIKQILAKDKVQKGYSEHGGHMSGGGGGKGTDAAISALTLLAFLFFLNVLQTCINEHMNAMEADTMASATVMPVSVRRQMDLAPVSKNTLSDVPIPNTPGFVGPTAEEYEYDDEYDDVETELMQGKEEKMDVDSSIERKSVDVVHLDFDIKERPMMQVVPNVEQSKSSETFLPVKIFKSKNIKKNPFL